MARIIVTLDPDEREALRSLAERELRDPRLQAALIIRRELRRRGLLPATDKAAGEPAKEGTDDDS